MIDTVSQLLRGIQWDGPTAVVASIICAAVFLLHGCIHVILCELVDLKDARLFKKVLYFTIGICWCCLLFAMALVMIVSVWRVFGSAADWRGGPGEMLAFGMVVLVLPVYTVARIFGMPSALKGIKGRKDINN